MTKRREREAAAEKAASAATATTAATTTDTAAAAVAAPSVKAEGQEEEEKEKREDTAKSLAAMRDLVQKAVDGSATLEMTVKGFIGHVQRREPRAATTELHDEVCPAADVSVRLEEALDNGSPGNHV